MCPELAGTTTDRAEALTQILAWSTAPENLLISMKTIYFSAQGQSIS